MLAHFSANLTIFPQIKKYVVQEKQMKNKGVPDFKTDTPDIMHYLRGITSLS